MVQEYVREMETMAALPAESAEIDDMITYLKSLNKLTGIATSGAQGKQMVADGLVKVDGQPESRKTAKIRPGQAVECRGVKVVVLAK